MNFADMSKKSFAIEDICEILSISKATARNWIRTGKMTPDLENGLFSREYIKNLVEELKSKENTRLKSRRNKKKVTGKILYKDYIHTVENRKVVEELLELGIIQTEKELRLVLANFAIQLYYQSQGISYTDNKVLMEFLKQKTPDDFQILVEDLLKDISVNDTLVKKLQPALEKELLFVKGEDSLGFVYISLRDIGQRKSVGAYYTPEKIVSELIAHLYENDKEMNLRTIYDPCCGTGNFLLCLGNKGIPYSHIYGQDIDFISVCLARMNLALLYPQMSAEELHARIIVGNFYFETFNRQFDIVLGNPPWGSDFSVEDAVKCRRIFKTSVGKNMEAYDLFVEKALSMLQPEGVLAFVLPEAILTVAAHDPVRRLILDTCSFRFVEYLGNVFSGVQCPSIILGIAPDKQKTTIGCKVITDCNKFTIEKERNFEDGTFFLHVSDEENECLCAISHIKNAAYLKKNARFALGIVTGNNKKYISEQKQEGYEIVLKGNEIQKYKIKASGNYIRFTPEEFQQVAPIEIYRAKEKLLYRFISEVPVFAYDDQQHLSLNSCNIVIPDIPGLEMKYILAILNSSVASYFLSKRFRSVKLLRSHLEQIPIPVVSKEKQEAIIKKVNRIMDSPENITSLYRELDLEIMNLYSLSERQCELIKKELETKNTFL